MIEQRKAVGVKSVSSREGLLRVQIVEGGRLAPARVHLRASDGRWRCPPGCIPYEKDEHFTTMGSFALSLPVGSTSITIERGKEWEPITDSFTMRGGKVVSRRYELHRWIDMARLGWYSGDTHVHRPIRQMLHLMEAEDLNVAPVITVWNEWDAWHGKLPGRRRIVTRGRRAYGVLSQEDERGGGALIGFDLVRPVRMRTTRWYPAQVVYAKRWKRQGALVEQEKPFWLEAPVNVALGVVDVIGIVNNHMQRADVMDHEAWGRPRDRRKYPGKMGYVRNVLDLYYRYLNLGIKIPISAGSASGVLRNPLGYNRLYVRLEEGFSYEGWFRGMKAGRGFATNGPMLFLEVGGRTPSLTESLPRFSCVELKIKTLSANGLRFVDLVRNGKVYRRFHLQGQREFEAIVQLKLKESCWIAARAFEENERTVRLAHSNPVFLEADCQPMTPSQDDALYYARWCEDLLRGLREEPGRFVSDRQRAEVERAYRSAISFYQGLAARAGPNERDCNNR